MRLHHLKDPRQGRLCTIVRGGPGHGGQRAGMAVGTGLPPKEPQAQTNHLFFNSGQARDTTRKRRPAGPTDRQVST